MEEPRRPERKTVSRSALETDQCTHVFQIDGYALHKDLVPAGKYIESAPFAVGGLDWCVLFYPNGDGDDYSEDGGDCVCVYLQLMCETLEAHRVQFDFRLVHPVTGLSSSEFGGDREFSSEDASWGTRNLMWISTLESEYVRNDRLVIECDVTVVIGTAVSKSETIFDIHVPPSDVLDRLGNMLEWEEGADVTFKVKEDVFHAHKFVLAMRSPVFKAELYGPMGVKNTNTIIIEDMQPSVFKAFLHFIYKDSLPAMDDLDEVEKKEMVKHLLVAADWYAMERMKVICESFLAKKLDAESVATTLALADQHHCRQLRDACIGFINTSNRVDDIVSSQGYEQLKKTSPSVIVEIWEKSTKSRKI